MTTGQAWMELAEMLADIDQLWCPIEPGRRDEEEHAIDACAGML